MEKLTITSVQNHDKKKDGTPMLDKRGKQQYRSVIKTVEKGDTMLTGFVYSPLREGQVIMANVTTENYQGNVQYRFAIATNTERVVEGAHQSNETMAELKTQTALLRQMVETLDRIQTDLLTQNSIAAIKGSVKPQVEENEPDELDSDFTDRFTDDINPADIPFG